MSLKMLLIVSLQFKLYICNIFKHSCLFKQIELERWKKKITKLMSEIQNVGTRHRYNNKKEVIILQTNSFFELSSLSYVPFKSIKEYQNYTIKSYYSFANIHNLLSRIYHFSILQVFVPNNKRSNWHCLELRGKEILN